MSNFINNTCDSSVESLKVRQLMEIVDYRCLQISSIQSLKNLASEMRMQTLLAETSRDLECIINTLNFMCNNYNLIANKSCHNRYIFTQAGINGFFALGTLNNINKAVDSTTVPGNGTIAMNFTIYYNQNNVTEVQVANHTPALEICNLINDTPIPHSLNAICGTKLKIYCVSDGSIALNLKGDNTRPVRLNVNIENNDLTQLYLSINRVYNQTKLHAKLNEAKNELVIWLDSGNDIVLYDYAGSATFKVAGLDFYTENKINGSITMCATQTTAITVGGTLYLVDCYPFSVEQDVTDGLFCGETGTLIPSISTNNLYIITDSCHLCCIFTELQTFVFSQCANKQTIMIDTPEVYYLILCELIEQLIDMDSIRKLGCFLECLYQTLTKIEVQLMLKKDTTELLVNDLICFIKNCCQIDKKVKKIKKNKTKKKKCQMVCTCRISEST